MNRTIKAFCFIALLVACALGATLTAGNESSVNLIDEQIMNLANRLYQNVAVYNVNNKFRVLSVSQPKSLVSI